MLVLTKAECYKILDLPETANQYDIENRYTMLVKRYRHASDPESREEIALITLAYNILTGRYVEPEPVDPRLEKVVLGKSLAQWKNIWHYGRVPLLVSLIALVLLGSLIYSIATNKPADFQLLAVGAFGTVDHAPEMVKEYIQASVPGVEKVEYQHIPLSFAEPEQPPANETGMQQGGLDPESEYAYIMKMMAIMAGDSIEVYLMEDNVFDQYAPQGAFAELDQLYASLADLPADIYAKVKPLRRLMLDQYEELYPEGDAPWENTADMDADESLPIYGLEVTDLHLTEGLGIFGKSQVLTVGIKADDKEQTEAFLAGWIRDYENMHERRLKIEAEILEDLSR
jgi:hypothetical protein